ncbi:hypothetical protein C8J56DRAFT_893385 [Mycena floridula]|nr:hypothetical protein C8J56DRAFT_893385 [Mycena floridula]
MARQNFTQTFEQIHADLKAVSSPSQKHHSPEKRINMPHNVLGEIISYLDVPLDLKQVCISSQQLRSAGLRYFYRIIRLPSSKLVLALCESLAVANSSLYPKVLRLSPGCCDCRPDSAALESTSHAAHFPSAICTLLPQLVELFVSFSVFELQGLAVVSKLVPALRSLRIDCDWLEYMPQGGLQPSQLLSQTPHQLQECTTNQLQELTIVVSDPSSEHLGGPFSIDFVRKLLSTATPGRLETLHIYITVSGKAKAPLFGGQSLSIHDLVGVQNLFGLSLRNPPFDFCMGWLLDRFDRVFVDWRELREPGPKLLLLMPDKDEVDSLDFRIHKPSQEDILCSAKPPGMIRPSGATQFPQELWLEITSYLDDPLDLLNCSWASSMLRCAVLPILYRIIVVATHKSVTHISNILQSHSALSAIPKMLILETECDIAEMGPQLIHVLVNLLSALSNIQDLHLVQHSFVLLHQSPILSMRNQLTSLRLQIYELELVHITAMLPYFRVLTALWLETKHPRVPMSFSHPKITSLSPISKTLTKLRFETVYTAFPNNIISYLRFGMGINFSILTSLTLRYYTDILVSRGDSWWFDMVLKEAAASLEQLTIWLGDYLTESANLSAFKQLRHLTLMVEVGTGVQVYQLDKMLSQLPVDGLLETITLYMTIPGCPNEDPPYRWGYDGWWAALGSEDSIELQEIFWSNAAEIICDPRKFLHLQQL